MQTLQHTKTLLKQGKSESQEIKIKVSMRDNYNRQKHEEKKERKMGKRDGGDTKTQNKIKTI